MSATERQQPGMYDDVVNLISPFAPTARQLMMAVDTPSPCPIQKRVGTL